MEANQDLIDYLLENSKIQQFIQKYPFQLQPRALKAALIFGILTLEGLAGTNLSVESIEARCKKLAACLDADAIFPEIKQRLTDLRQEIDVLDELVEEKENRPHPIPRNFAPPPPPKQRPPNAPQRRELSPRRVTYTHEPTYNRSRSVPSMRTLYCPKAPSDWRKGDGNVFQNSSPKSQKQANKDLEEQEEIYPKWWTSLGEIEARLGGVSEKVTNRAPPELPQRVVRTKHDSTVNTIARKSQKAKNQTVQRSHVPQRVPRAHFQDSGEMRDVQVEADFSSEGTPVAVRLPEEPPRPRFRQDPQEVAILQEKQQQYGGWVGDFTSVVKRSPSSIRSSPARASHYNWASSDQSQAPQIQPLPETQGKVPKQLTVTYHDQPLRPRSSYNYQSQSSDLVESRRQPGEYSSNSGSSMSAYHPSEEMRKFYQQEFHKLMDSRGVSLRSTLSSHEPRNLQFSESRRYQI